MSLMQDLQAAMDTNDPAELARIEALLDAEDAATRLRLAEPRALKQAAHYYAATLGWEVFPCKPGQKVPATKHGLHDATLDEDQINTWWDTNPQFNIGLPTGTFFDVIDIDGHPGMQSLLQWMRETDSYTDTFFGPRLGTVLTPRRPGMHIYTPPTGEGNNAAMKGQRAGIDYRGLGGYVLAPPSRTEHGTYTWATPVVAP